ncbi:MAG TPA: hypothetical protein DCY40_04020 [Actinobacteria bacterium]|nr:hypothetical protein [Actinomycetota bacterium]
MGSVFISYSSKDRHRVAVSADTLRVMGPEVAGGEVVAGRAIGQGGQPDAAAGVGPPASVE